MSIGALEGDGVVEKQLVGESGVFVSPPDFIGMDNVAFPVSNASYLSPLELNLQVICVRGIVSHCHARCNWLCLNCCYTATLSSRTPSFSILSGYSKKRCVPIDVIICGSSTECCH
jgi:hypothetical protein